MNSCFFNSENSIFLSPRLQHKVKVVEVVRVFDFSSHHRQQHHHRHITIKRTTKIKHTKNNNNNKTSNNAMQHDETTLITHLQRSEQTPNTCTSIYIIYIYR